jgi:hypothetical protein
MARAHFVKKARKDIWSQGKEITKTHMSGKNKGNKYTTYDTSVKGDKSDTLLIKKGESYWWWAFRFGGKHISKEEPKRSQLTQSEWLSRAYSVEEEIDEFVCTEPEELESAKDWWLSEIESMKDEAEKRLGNMPEGLQENSSSGQTLQEYIDAFDNWHSELDGIDTDIGEEVLKSEAEESVDEDTEDDGTEDRETRINNAYNELLQEKLNEILSEMQSIGSGL